MSYGPADEAEARRLKEQVQRLWKREQEILRELGWRPELRLLDVGCGTGGTLRLLSNPFSAGVDRDAQLLAHARGLRALRADARALPFCDGSFDLVMMRFVLRHLAERTRALAEMVRVCAPGGLVVVIDADDLGWALEPEPEGWTRLSAALGESARRRGGDPGMGRRLRGLLLGAGLHDVRGRLQPITTDDLPAAVLVDTFLAPAARPLDADLLPPDHAAQAWAHVRQWSQRADAYGWVIGVAASGRK